LRLARVDRFQAGQRFVDGDEIGQRGMLADDVGVEAHALGAAPETIVSLAVM